jgi:DHA1 family bicyclomycin/chloramphenicol resistance-like MFS transporter
MLTFAVVALALTLLKLPETNGPDKRGNVFLSDYFRAYARVLRNKQGWAYLICGGLSYAAMFAYITGSPFVYIQLFGVAPTHFGLYFAINVVGLFLGTWINSLLVMRYGYLRLLAIGVSVSLVGGLFLLFVSHFTLGGLPAIVVGLFITIAPASMIGANCTVGLLNNFPHNAGAAAALFGVAQFGLGSIASLLVGLFYDGTPMAMTLSISLACLGSMLALVWLFQNRHLSPYPDIFP